MEDLSVRDRFLNLIDLIYVVGMALTEANTSYAYIVISQQSSAKGLPSDTPCTPGNVRRTGVEKAA